MLKLPNKMVTGYSLIELIVTIVVTSIVMIIFYSIFAPNQKNSVSSVLQIKAAELGQAYLEEIIQKKFDENTPIGNAQRCNQLPSLLCGPIANEEGAGNRSLFDDVDDYNGLDDQPAQDAFGNNRVGFDSFRVTVVVSYAGADFGLSNQDLKRVDVTVIAPQGENFVFSQYKGNF
ncbi:MAG: type II secretion system GspH family protein [Kangiellaceae bacterium]|nr:type II secretion system GspH family protein [Kangiellaceae bacterium]